MAAERCDACFKPTASSRLRDVEFKWDPFRARICGQCKPEDVPPSYVENPRNWRALKRLAEVVYTARERYDAAQKQGN